MSITVETGSRRATRAAEARARISRASALADRLFKFLTGSMAWLILILLAGAAFSMFWGGRLAFATFGWKFLYSTAWDPVTRRFGALVPIYGTVVSSFIAILIALPMSFGVAVFLSEVAPRWLRGPVGAAIELLAAIPSIIYGMWGLFVFVPFMSLRVEPWLNDKIGPAPIIGALFTGPPIGIGMLTAGIILGIMIIPFISAVMRDVFMAVPDPLREASFSLGATTWETVWRVSLPYTRTAVVGAVFLGLGRALGETMAVTFVLGNAHDFTRSLLMPGNSIAAAIANEFTEADSKIYLSSLIALGFLLFVVTFIVLAGARLLLSRIGRLEGGRA
ncbi:MAG: phosphate ABC transporter permease subunit PstC [Caulobacteraceae bacterium]